MRKWFEVAGPEQGLKLRLSHKAYLIDTKSWSQMKLPLVV